MKKDNSKNKIKWTEIAQAFAAIIAILGGIAGFYKLFSTDSEMQEQLEKLTVMANETSAQTKIMSQELLISRSRIDLQMDQLAIEKEKWKKQNSPDFAIDLGNYDFWYELDDSIKIGFSLNNIGGSAQIIDVTENKENTCKLQVPNSYVPSQGVVRFNLYIPKKMEVYLDFNLIYKDNGGIIYTQRFKSDRISYKKFKARDDEGLDVLNIESEKPVKYKFK